MGFQIKDKDGNAITINHLDEEAATLWGVELKQKIYASPYKDLVKPETFASDEEKKKWSMKSLDNTRNQITCNWFDNVGFIIHKGKATWKEVKDDYLEPYLEALKKYEDRPDYDNFKKAFLGGHVQSMCDLIDHWESKGYVPVPVKD